MLDPVQGLTQYVPDANGRVTLTIDPLGWTTTTLYDKAGNVRRSPTGRGGSKYLYDADGRVAAPRTATTCWSSRSSTTATATSRA